MKFPPSSPSHPVPRRTSKKEIPLPRSALFYNRAPVCISISSCSYPATSTGADQIVDEAQVSSWKSCLGRVYFITEMLDSGSGVMVSQVVDINIESVGIEVGDDVGFSGSRCSESISFSTFKAPNSASFRLRIPFSRRVAESSWRCSGFTTWVVSGIASVL